MSGQRSRKKTAYSKKNSDLRGFELLSFAVNYIGFLGKSQMILPYILFFLSCKKENRPEIVRRFSRNEFEKWLRVEEILEGLAEFKNGLLASRDFDFFFGLRIDTGLCGYVLDLEGAEAHQLYFVCPLSKFR